MPSSMAANKSALEDDFEEKEALLHSGSGEPDNIVSASKPAFEDDFEEQEALLHSGSGEPDRSADIEDKDGWSSRKITLTALVLIILLITGAFTIVLCGSPSRKRQPAASSILRSNGTHEFKPTVVIVSIDGLRCVLLHQEMGSMYEIEMPL
jgi:hypothetical protein